MSEVLYLGSGFHGQASVEPNTRLRIAFRDAPSTFGKIFLASFDARVKAFIENLPGASEVAYPLPPAATSLNQGVAVVDIVANSQVPWGMSAADFVQRISQALNGAEIFRVTRLPGAQSLSEGQAGRTKELETAIAGDKALDEVERKESFTGRVTDAVTGGVRTAGNVLLFILVAVIVLAGLFVYKHGGTAAEAVAKRI